MKAAVLESLGLDNLRVKEIAEPRLGPCDVLVRMRAASLNYRDLVTIDGGYRSQQKRSDLIVLSDGAGEVAATGDSVSEFRIGDRVVACFFQDWHAGRATAERLRSGLGVLSGGRAELNLGPVVTRQVRMLGITVGSRDRLGEMIAAMATTEIRPVIDRVFPLAEIRDALLYLKAGKHFGKVCIEI